MKKIGFILFVLCTVNGALGQSLMPAYDSFYKVHIRLPAEGWAINHGSVFSECLFHTRKIWYKDTAGDHFDPALPSVSLGIPYSSSNARDVFNTAWNNCCYRYLDGKLYAKERGTLAGGARYYCDLFDNKRDFDTPRRLVRPDVEEMFFLFEHNGQVFLLKCVASVGDFDRYRQLFLDVARSVRFD